METMKTKKDVINKFKELEGKTIKVFTCDNTVVGCFKPKNSMAFFHIKGATMQKRVIKKVTKDRVVMQRTEINYIGFKDAEEFCDDWIYNFVSNLAISDTKTESRKKVQEDFKRQFYDQYANGDLLYPLHEEDRIVCDFPSIKDMEISTTVVKMYNNYYILEECK